MTNNTTPTTQAAKAEAALRDYLPNPDPAEAPGDVILATITVTRSITPDSEYVNSYAITGEPGLVTTLGMLTWAQHTIFYDTTHPTGEPE